MRPEVEVAADAVWALFEARLLRKQPETVVRAAEVAGITVADLRAASARYEGGWRSRPGRGDPEPSVRARGDAQPAPRVQPSRSTSPAADDDPERLPPQPTDRTCAACGQILPAAKFAGDDRTCRRCRNLRRRELRVEKARLVNAARLVFQVTDADALRPPLCCLDCGLAFHVGEWVTATAGLHHVDCPADGRHRRGHVPQAARAGAS